MGRAYQRVINDYVYRTSELLDRFGAEIEVFARQAYVTASQAFQQVHGGRITFTRSDQTCQEAFPNVQNANCWASAAIDEITFYQRETARNVPNPETGEMEPERVNVDVTGRTLFLVHELAHSFEGRVNTRLRTRPGETPVRGALAADTIIVRRTPGNFDEDDEHYGFAGPFPGWQQSEAATSGEELADMVIGWVYSQWDMRDGVLTPQAQARSAFMDRNMPAWVLIAAGYTGRQ
jgi:hypothetical protein